VVTAGTATRSDVNLELGGMSETVTVRAARTSPPPAMPQRTGAPQRIPVGGSVQIARLVRQPRPVYPEALKQQGVTGVVMIKTVVSKEGETVNPQVVNTDVHPDMAQAALDAVRQWRYTPTLLNGQPVETVTTVEIRFELDQ
jgi:protein TonB